MGCVASDHFMKNIDNDQFFIINNEPSNSRGEHFIAVYKYKNKFYMYDSFNRDNKSLSSYWKDIKHIVKK
jgi:hypothetical protein